MSGFKQGKLDKIELPGAVPPGLPRVFDDTSLAYALGIRPRTLWWLIHLNKRDRIEGGDGAYKEFKIPKSNGKSRLIHEPCKALKQVQKSVMVTFFNPLPLPDHVGAYVLGKDIKSTAEKHVGKKVKLSLDISNFFNSTRRPWVRDFLRSLGYPEAVVIPLSNLLVVPIKIGKPPKKPRILSVLPQGAPTSGIVANHIAASRIDAPLTRMLETTFGSQGWVYTRYADDLAISFENDVEAAMVDAVRDQAIDIIRKGGYLANPRKTKVQRHNSPKIPMQVLGMTVNEKLNIPRREYRALRAIVFNCHKHGIASQVGRYKDVKTAEELIDSVWGRLRYWAQISEKMEPLMNQFSEAVAQHTGSTKALV